MRMRGMYNICQGPNRNVRELFTPETLVNPIYIFKLLLKHLRRLTDASLGLGIPQRIRVPQYLSGVVYDCLALVSLVECTTGAVDLAGISPRVRAERSFYIPEWYPREEFSVRRRLSSNRHMPRQLALASSQPLHHQPIQGITERASVSVVSRENLAVDEAFRVLDIVLALGSELEHNEVVVV
jgi:hypothetical protein